MTRVLIFCLFAGVALAQNPLQRQLPLANNEANRLYEEKKFDEARSIYEKLYKEDPKNGAVAYNLGNTYSAMGDVEKASELYQEALKSDHVEAVNRSKFNLGTLNMAKQNPQEAVNAFTEYLRNNPDDLDAKRNLELSLRMMEQAKDQQKQDPNQQKQEQQQQEQQESQGEQQSSQDQQDQQDQQNQQGQQQNPSEGEQQQQEQQQQGQDQQDPKDPQGQEQESKQNEGQSDDQQGAAGKQGENDEEKDQNSSAESKDDALKDQGKQQILDALDQQELNQQKQFQQRKMGAVKRRAKDW